MSEERASKDLQALDSGADFLQPVSGWVIGARGGGVMRLETDSHLATIGKTGAGKGTAVAIPNLLTHEGSVLSIEIGGDTYRNTFNYRKIVMGQNIRIIDPFGVTGAKTDSINLLAELKKCPEHLLEENAKDMCACIYGEEALAPVRQGKDGDNSIFYKIAAQITLAHMLYILSSKDIKADEQNFSTLRKYMNHFGTGDGEFDLRDKFLKDTGPYSGQYGSAARYVIDGQHINKDRTTFGVGITLNSCLSFTDSKLMESVSNHSTFDLSELQSGKSTLYVVMPKTTLLDTVG